MLQELQGDLQTALDKVAQSEQREQTLVQRLSELEQKLNHAQVLTNISDNGSKLDEE